MAMPTATGDRTLAAVAYILTLITGIIILLVAKKEDRYARWHAIQAIGLGLVLIVLNILLGIAGLGFALGGSAAGAFGFFGLSGIVGLLALILIVVLAIKAYQGESVRLPIIADFADKNA